MPEYTKTQQRILAVLADGRRHHRTELKAVLADQEADIRTVAVHLTHLRKKMRPIGEDIICEVYQRKTYYRHVRLLAPAHD